MSAVAANQGRTFLRLFAELLPHVRTDRNLPARLQQRLSAEKRFGSRDRRLYRELCYTALRHLPWVEELLGRSDDEALRGAVWLAADMPATRPLKETLLHGWPAGPVSVAQKVAQLGTTTQLLPEWFRSHCPAAFEPPEIDVLHSRTPLWVRLQTEDHAGVLTEFSERAWTMTGSGVLEDAYRIDADVDVTKTHAFTTGQLEVQDLGSQLLLAAVSPAPGTRWRDACAGAGGKTLQLARLLGASGHVDATDPRVSALDELRLRAARARQPNVSIVQSTEAPSPRYDGVLVDAPCSGSGTWRRSPHLKWCGTEAQVEAAAALQQAILVSNASWVRPGGLLVYATCSLSRRENEDVVSDFLYGHPEFAPEPFSRAFGAVPAPPAGLVIRPSLHNTDGFFVAALRRGNT